MTALAIADSMVVLLCVPSKSGMLPCFREQGTKSSFAGWHIAQPVQEKMREFSPKFLKTLTYTADCVSLLPTAYTVPG